MRARMLCTDCGVTAHADTVLEGSDRAEAAAWVIGAAIGWLYCARRHFLRAKACARCGSMALVRESQAAARVARPCDAETRVLSPRGQVAWPRGLRTPRERLRAGAPAALVAVILFFVGVGAAAHGVPLRWLGAAGLTWTLGAAGWSLLAVLRRRLTLPWVPECRAWDAGGRQLHIEVV